MRVPVTDRQRRITRNSDIEFVIPKYYVESQPSALRPGDISFSFPTFNNLGAEFTDFKIQGFELAVSIPRDTIIFLGQNIPEDRKPVQPIYADLAFNMIVGDSKSGSLMDLVRQDNPYNFSITVRHPTGQFIALRYDFSGAYFQGIDYATSIGSNKSANLRFRTELISNSIVTGLFMSGIVETPDLVRMTLLTESGTALELESLADSLEIEPILLGPTTF
jgi:hypothetical protein